MRFSVTGEVSRDHLSQPGSVPREGLGGCATYLSLALGRLGAEVIFATVAGDDLDPAWLKPLHAAGVDVRMRRLLGPTAQLDLAYDQHGDIAQLRFEAGVESQMNVSQLPDDFWSGDWIIIGTGPRRYQTSVVVRAHEIGRPVALSTQREFQGDWGALATLLPHLELLFINSGEVVDLHGDALPIGLDALHAANPRLTCVVTCGPRGAFLLRGEWLYRVAACPGPIINTTGAGDVFAAAWLSTFVRTGDPGYALQAASVAASLALRGLAHTALPRWDQVANMLEDCDQKLPVESWPAGSTQARTALAIEDAHCHRALERQVTRA
jgi:sugar/nucleoside kinase (ribokinase family)